MEFPQNLRTPEFAETWNRWEPFRRTKKNCKDWHTLFQEQLNWLGTFPEKTAIAMLTQSIRNGWQGIFEVKNGSAVAHQPEKPTTIFALKAQKEAKEELARQIKNKHASEGPLGDTWDDPEQQKKYRTLRREIKELNERMANL